MTIKKQVEVLYNNFITVDKIKNLYENIAKELNLEIEIETINKLIELNCFSTKDIIKRIVTDFKQLEKNNSILNKKTVYLN